MNRFRVSIAVWACLITLLVLVQSDAATRTTPTTVENTPTVKVDATQNAVKIDPAANTVQAQQIGAWDVGLLGTPNVNIANTPSFTLSGTGNIVSTPTQSNTIQLWTSDQIVDPGEFLYSGNLYFQGYREMRLFLCSNRSDSQIRACVRFRSPNGWWIALGYGDFGVPSQPLVPDANFTNTSSHCVMAVPILSDIGDVYIYNTGTTSATIRSYSWAYLVN